MVIPFKWNEIYPSVYMNQKQTQEHVFWGCMKSCFMGILCQHCYICNKTSQERAKHEPRSCYSHHSSFISRQFFTLLQIPKNDHVDKYPSQTHWPLPIILKKFSCGMLQLVIILSCHQTVCFEIVFLIFHIQHLEGKQNDISTWGTSSWLLKSVCQLDEGGGGWLHEHY